MAELVDALDLGSSDENREGSSPSLGTKFCCKVLSLGGGIGRRTSFRY